MKTNPNDLLKESKLFQHAQNRDGVDCVSGGLTKREYFAAMALVGILCGRKQSYNDSNKIWATDAAVASADSLIRRLNE